MPDRGNPLAVTTGPGTLLIAVLGSTEPVDLSTAWASAWKPLGYTNEGSTQSMETSFDPIEVAEELDALDMVATGRTIKVSFDAAENTVQNYRRAMNGGLITVTGTNPNQVFKYEPPNLGEEVRVMLGFEAEDHLERWVWRLCLQTGSTETSRKKGSDKALVPMEFSCFKPNGAKPFMRLSNRSGDASS